MPTLYMVRHGRTASSITETDDPRLSAEGQAQARAVARELSALLPESLPIVTSPLLRCRETAAPLCALWRQEPLVEPRLAEILGPEPVKLARSEWLRRALIADWSELIELGEGLEASYGTRLADWRKGVCEAALACRTDVVIFSHFVPINTLVGRALRSERVVSFQPDHTSVTVFTTTPDDIQLVKRGREMTVRYT